MPGTGIGTGDPERKSQGHPGWKSQADGLGPRWTSQLGGESGRRHRMGELPKVQTSAIRPACRGHPTLLVEAAPGSGAWPSWRPWNPTLIMAAADLALTLTEQAWGQPG